ncbi:F1-ATP synthase assembly protein [Phaffia rhodozyma]|uniref:F1-ATP synthase assembly protein n=1 Tax=Phaffia rhodozyma TaxID=264483 RepID=A0A0F7SQV3_PHARH|nr:F1-ATP synthase assembly protein [Phaffia rhodozyma]
MSIRLPNMFSGVSRAISKQQRYVSRSLPVRKAVASPASAYVLPQLKIDGQNATQSGLNPTKQAEKTFGRFWKTVQLDTTPNGTPAIVKDFPLQTCQCSSLCVFHNYLLGIRILLDTRPLRTPGGNPLMIPAERKALAFLIANEWENQEKVLKNHALPMTSLASRAIDAFASTKSTPEENIKSRTDVTATLLRYLDTDTICFHETHPTQLVRLQNERWVPILDWVREAFKVEVNVFGSVLMSRQPPKTVEVLREAVMEFPSWKLAAFERAVYTTKSFFIALALVEGRLTIEQASLASQVEVDSQIEVWGEVEDTHDVDYQDVRRQLGSIACLLLQSK